MHQQNPSTAPSVASTSTPSSANKLDPIAVLREELAAAALCHGVERVEDLTEALVTRVVQRLGGGRCMCPASARWSANVSRKKSAPSSMAATPAPWRGSTG